MMQAAAEQYSQALSRQLKLDELVNNGQGGICPQKLSRGRLAESLFSSMLV